MTLPFFGGGEQGGTRDMLCRLYPCGRKRSYTNVEFFSFHCDTEILEGEINFLGQISKIIFP